MSDSIVITAPVERANPYTFYSAFWSVGGCVSRCMMEAIDAGFMVRGGLEFGPIYRAGPEIIGPGFIDAYLLESRVADIARVVLGPELLDYIRLHQADLAFTDRSTMYCSDDGLIALRPTQAKSEQVLALRDSVAHVPKLVRKYGEFVRFMAPEMPHPTIGQIRVGAALVRRRLREPASK
jgi:hypothetical protein